MGVTGAAYRRDGCGRRARWEEDPDVDGAARPPGRHVTDAVWDVDELDLRVAARLCRLVGADDPALVTLGALAASAPRGGHVCVDLADVDGPVVLQRRSPTGGGPRPEPEPLDPLVGVDDVLDRAVAASLARAAGAAGRVTPLVVDGTRVYLDRYWAYEDALYRDLVDRSALAVPPEDPAVVRDVLDRVAPHDPAGPEVDRQRLAVANGLLRPLSVLSGGPGTGKTHTVVSVLVAHVLLAGERGDDVPRMAIAAPTGKAAARLEEAIRDAVRDRAMPTAATEVAAGLQGHTLHRLLGHRRSTPTRFRHDRDNPLPHDVVVVDEASMVPLSLMAKLVAAVRPDATVVLVGDRDQLTSVEAGAVLGDICGPRPRGSSLRLSDAWTEVLTEVTGSPVDRERDAMPGPGVWDGVVQLERSFRFGERSGIGAVARAIQRVDDDAGEVVAFLTGGAVEEDAEVGRYGDVELLAPDDGPTLPASLRPTVVDAFAPYVGAVAAGEAAAALDALDALRVLCAVRAGPLGVRAVGGLVEAWVADASQGVLRPGEEWYAGRPVLVTRNDHDLGVMNGDVGVALERGGRTVVAFRHADGEVREVPAVRVADCETVWAMTIHKSQGSQFDHAVVVLPERESPVTTRELLYTGATRARERVTVVATEQRLREAAARPVRRATGLAQRLWPPPSRASRGRPSPERR